MLVGKIVGGQYVCCEEAGPRDRERLRDMLERQQGPTLMTDAVFMEGRCNGNQFEKSPAIGDWYKGQATAAGVDTTGRVYLSGLAAYPGDPRAWVGSRGEVQKVVEERGWNCRGAVNVASTEPGGTQCDEKRQPVAEDLVQEAVMEAVVKNPELAEKDVGEVREQVLDRLKPPWK